MEKIDLVFTLLFGMLAVWIVIALLTFYLGLSRKKSRPRWQSLVILGLGLIGLLSVILFSKASISWVLFLLIPLDTFLVGFGIPYQVSIRNKKIFLMLLLVLVVCWLIALFLL